ncbi:ABC transporter ATP-binding protein [Phragmitibacter flavus]|uniref:ABC transporter ATP-binding protein n=1 Tax=Phragmitibacter flavus TaxID=2576071 RepID=A0A5R8KG40_9BACT|nr:ABC transporter ATP-binding protein [Phragmitibacter flavus]TLD71256.1 ABC transporter ATP-binding protein [Phragmitibacter flavus]
MVSISIRHVSKMFTGHLALNDVSLEVERGELFFLLGPSGCGKTTLLRHIAGFYTPDKGQILFDGRDVSKVPPHQRGAAMMFQSYALWPHLTVSQNVGFGLEERKLPRAEITQRVAEALKLVKMDGLGERRIQALSGGQQQRVALARALVVRPSVFMLDEPLSNLDARLRIEMRSEIRRICKEFGLTGIYVTHDQKEALSMADRMAVMDGGKVAQVGTPMQVYRQPVNKMVAEFIGETNLIDGTVKQASYRSGYWDVETASGLLRGRATETLEPVAGQPVTLSIRPEAISFYDLPDSPNRFFGNLLERTYLGEQVQYELSTRDGHLLRFAEMNPREVYDPGIEEIRVNVSADDVLILRR